MPPELLPTKPFKVEIRSMFADCGPSVALCTPDLYDGFSVKIIGSNTRRYVPDGQMKRLLSEGHYKIIQD